MHSDGHVDDSREPIAGQTIRHGTGVTATRAFPTNAYPSNLDPFVLFERFFIDPNEGFPTHLHRGFEIVSYMLEGGMEHEDSLSGTTGQPSRPSSVLAHRSTSRHRWSTSTFA
nr:pirin family protein [Natronorubrum aibiense]